MDETVVESNSVQRVGFWAAGGLGVVGVLYAVAVTVGVLQAGSSAPIVDPVLAVMEALTLLSAPLLVILFAALHGYAPLDRKIFSLIALAFGTLMAGLTSAVHFVGLTAGRQLGDVVLEWPTVDYALELLAWDVFLGFALVFAAPVVRGGGLFAATRWTLATTGLLCLIGTIGPAMGDMEIQRIGILGYGIGLPVSSFLLAAVFRSGERTVKHAEQPADLGVTADRVPGC